MRKVDGKNGHGGLGGLKGLEGLYKVEKLMGCGAEELMEVCGNWELGGIEERDLFVE